jgi:hypothetical protein
MNFSTPLVSRARGHAVTALRLGMIWLLLVSGCVSHPPPPAAHAPSNLPPLPEAKPQEGLVVVDVTDGASMANSLLPNRPGCLTPCTLALPLGSQQLKLTYVDRSGHTHQDETSVRVLEQPQVLRRTMKRMVVEKPNRLAIASVIYHLGLVSMLAALAAWPFARRGDWQQNTAQGLAIAGGGAMLLSFPLVIGTFHRSNGSEVQFPLVAPQNGPTGQGGAN